MPERDRRIRTYFLDRLFVAHGRGERLLRAGLACLPDPVASSPLADRLLFERAWRLDPAAPALRPDGDGAAAPRRAAELWTSAGPLLATAARAAAGRGGLPNAAEQILERSILLRDYAGHGRRQLVLFPFPHGADVPSAVVKVSRAAGGSDAEEASSLRAEWETLGRLADELPPGLAATVPAPLAYESSDGVEVLVVSHVEGRPVYLDLQNRLLTRREARSHFREAADWLSAFHRATRRPGRRVSVTPEDRTHADRLTGAGARSRDHRWLDDLSARLDVHPVPLSAGHGDYWPRNLLLRRVGRGEVDRSRAPEAPPAGVVDWDRFAAEAPPFDDLFHFAIAYGSSVRWRGREDGRTGLAEAFRRTLFAENRVASAVGGYLERYAARAELPSSLLPPLLRLHVLRRHRRAADPCERAGWEACRRRLAAGGSPVLERLE